MQKLSQQRDAVSWKLWINQYNFKDILFFWAYSDVAMLEQTITGVNFNLETVKKVFLILMHKSTLRNIAIFFFLSKILFIRGKKERETPKWCIIRPRCCERLCCKQERASYFDPHQILRHSQQQETSSRFSPAFHSRSLSLAFVCAFASDRKWWYTKNSFTVSTK